MPDTGLACPVVQRLDRQCTVWADEPHLSTTVASARHVLSTGGDRPIGLLELAPCAVAAVSGVDVKYDDVFGDAATEQGVGPFAPPVGDGGDVGGAVVEAVRGEWRFVGGDGEDEESGVGVVGSPLPHRRIRLLGGHVHDAPL